MQKPKMETLPVEIVWMFIDYLNTKEYAVFSSVSKYYNKACKDYLNKFDFTGIKSVYYPGYKYVNTTRESVIAINSRIEAMYLRCMNLKFANVIINCDDSDKLLRNGPYENAIKGLKYDRKSFEIEEAVKISNIVKDVVDVSDYGRRYKLSVVECVEGSNLKISTLYIQGRRHIRSSGVLMGFCVSQMMNSRASPTSAVIYDGVAYSFYSMVRKVFDDVKDALCKHIKDMRLCGDRSDKMPCITRIVYLEIVKQISTSVRSMISKPYTIKDGKIVLSTSKFEKLDVCDEKMPQLVSQTYNYDGLYIVNHYITDSQIVELMSPIKKYAKIHYVVNNVINRFLFHDVMENQKKQAEEPAKTTNINVSDIDMDKLRKSTRRGKDTYSLNYMKSLCKELGLPSSGPKRKVCERLIEELS